MGGGEREREGGGTMIPVPSSLFSSPPPRPFHLFFFYLLASTAESKERKISRAPSPPHLLSGTDGSYRAVARLIVFPGDNCCLRGSTPHPPLFGVAVCVEHFAHNTTAAALYPPSFETRGNACSLYRGVQAEYRRKALYEGKQFLGDYPYTRY